MASNAAETAYPDDIPALTSLRFFAALAVFVYHMHLVTDIPHNAATLLLYKGFLGVDFFFILSGFILTHVYYPQVMARTFTARGFLINRLARIYPLHLATMLIAFIFGLAFYKSGWTSDTSAPAVVQNLFLIQAWGLARTFSLNKPAWSLSAEWFAYLLFPILIWMFIRPKPSFLLFLSLWLYVTFWISSNITFGVPFTELTYFFSTMRIAPEFCLGMALCLYGRRHAFRLHGAAAVLALVTLLVLVLYAKLPDPLAVLVLALIILTVAEGSRRDEGKLLGKRLFVYLGEISYAMYMVHFLTLFVIYLFRDSAVFPLMLAAALPATILCSMALHHGVELPCRRIIRKLK